MLSLVPVVLLLASATLSEGDGAGSYVVQLTTSPAAASRWWKETETDRVVVNGVETNGVCLDTSFAQAVAAQTCDSAGSGRAKRSTAGVVGERFLDPAAARDLAGPRPRAADVPLAGGVGALCHDAGVQPSDARHRPEWTVAVGCPAAGWRAEECLRHRANHQSPQPPALAADQSSGTTAGPAAAATPQPRQDLARQLEPHRIARCVPLPDVLYLST